MLRLFWKRYQAILAQQPLLTKASTSCILMAASDASTQTLERQFQQQLLQRSNNDSYRNEYCNKNNNINNHNNKPINITTINLQKGCPANVNCPPCENSTEEEIERLQHHDWERTVHLGLTGMFYSGPISHAWYQILERIMCIIPNNISSYYYGGIAIRMIFDAFLFSPIAVAGYFTVRSILEGKSIQELVDKLHMKWSKAVIASWSFWPAANIISFSIVPLQLRVLYGNFMGLFWSTYLNVVNNRRLEHVVEQRQQYEIQQQQQQQQKGEGDTKAQKTQDFAATPEGQAAHSLICVCSHCRAMRA